MSQKFGAQSILVAIHLKFKKSKLEKVFSYSFSFLCSDDLFSIYNSALKATEECKNSKKTNIVKAFC